MTPAGTLIWFLATVTGANSVTVEASTACVVRSPLPLEAPVYMARVSQTYRENWENPDSPEHTWTDLAAAGVTRRILTDFGPVDAVQLRDGGLFANGQRVPAEVVSQPRSTGVHWHKYELELLGVRRPVMATAGGIR